MFNVFIGVAAAPTKHTDFAAARLETQGSPQRMLLPSLSPVLILLTDATALAFVFWSVSSRLPFVAPACLGRFRRAA